MTTINITVTPEQYETLKQALSDAKHFNLIRSSEELTSGDTKKLHDYYTNEYEDIKKLIAEL